MAHRGVFKIASCALVMAFALPVRAQDMSFGLEDTGSEDAPAPPPQEGPPSEALANAFRLYQNERYQEASVQFQRVVQGETDDATGNVHKAQFFLGKSLYHLHFYQSALTVFDEISATGGSHLFFGQTLQWLAQLASQLPEPAGIIEKVGRYSMDQLQQFDTAENADLYNQLLYLMGRSKYEQGEFEQAVDLFGRVDRSSSWYVKSRFFQGISHIRMRKAQPAISAFREILEAIEEGDAEGIEDEERMRDLAWISLARVYYTASNKGTPDGSYNVDGKLLGAAVDAWNRIDKESEYWLDAVFESSWALFLADEYARALGNVHTLYSPYFKNAFYPEAMVLKGVTFFTNCQMKNARAIVERFHRRYDPVKRELDEVLAKYEDNEEFFKFLKRVRSEDANLPKNVRGVVASALSDRTVLQNLEYVELLEAEEKKLKESPPAFEGSAVGSRILQDILVAKSFAIEQAGDLARERYNRLISELQDLFNQIDTVDLEIATYERGQLSQELQKQQTIAAETGGGEVEVDSEHQLWPFDGEYWRDELGYYRQQVTNKCGR